MRVKSKNNKFIKSLLIVCLFIASLFLICLISFTIMYNKYNLDKTKLTSLNNGITVYSSDKTPSIHNTNRSIVNIDELPTYVLDAFVETEDKRFYSHNGYDLKRIIKAGIVNITSKSKSQGASTISQQLIKNALLSNEKTYSRKLQEVILAMKLEKEFSKKEILEMYINTIYFGSNAFGIENASLTYFNKSSKDLTLNEACCLAGIIKSPSYYSPKYNYNNAISRRNIVAKNMLNAGKINLDQYNSVINSNLTIETNTNIDNSYEKCAILEACRLLNISERNLINKQYAIITFMNNQLQNEVKEINSNVITANKNKFNTHLDSLSIVVNNQGQVLSYFENSNYNLSNLTRQSASILKPLAVYLPAIQHNILSPATKILDEEIDYSGYSPTNADKLYHGYISAKEALSQSYNIPAVKILDCIGLEKSRECLNKLGINIANSDLNLSLALGATKKGVNVMNIVQAYNTIASLGYHNELCFVKEIIDKNGNSIYKHKTFSEKVFNEDDCYLLTEMLKETAKTGTAKRLNSLNLNVASKTGTANNGNSNTDLYNVSYTTEHTVFSWIANVKDNILPNEMLSSVQPTEINKQILSTLYSNANPKDFVKPESIQYLPYDLIEYEENNRIITPTTSLDRYIAYDYFKECNPPLKIEINNDVELNVDIDKSGSIISFFAKKNNIYNVYKKINGEEFLIKEISDTNGLTIFQDKNIFKNENIDYYIKNENNVIISKIYNIKPKDYIVNLLNNNILAKNWYV